MHIEEMAQLLRAAVPGLKVLKSEPMSAHTSFGIGGPADLLCTPANLQQLTGALQFAIQFEIPPLIIGKGSNLLVSDQGIHALVIETAGLEGIRLLEGHRIEAECGVSMARLALFAREHALTGLEFAHGIPGTVGGAIYMNAGAYGGEMSQIVQETDCVTRRGEWKLIVGENHRFGYRESLFVRDPELIVVRARMQLRPGDYGEIAERMRELREKRQGSQPLQYPSAGSFFKRPTGYFAGKLIADCGLKGLSVGGAKVSEKHAGFIINTGGATCSDVLCLMEEIRMRVRDQFGVELEPEVRILGENYDDQ